MENSNDANSNVIFSTEELLNALNRLNNLIETEEKTLINKSLNVIFTKSKNP